MNIIILIGIGPWELASQHSSHKNNGYFFHFIAFYETLQQRFVPENSDNVIEF